MSSLLTRIIDVMTSPPPPAGHCPTCEQPIVTIDPHGTLEVYHKDHTRKISLVQILKAVRSQKGKETIRRYAKEK